MILTMEVIFFSRLFYELKFFHGILAKFFLDLYEYYNNKDASFSFNEVCKIKSYQKFKKQKFTFLLIS